MNYKQLFIGVVLGLIIGLMISRKGPPEQVVSTTTVTIPGDTIFKELVVTKTQLKEKIVYKEIVRIDTLEIDTLAILQDYYTKYAYRDTVQAAECTIFISDTLYTNKIISRVVGARNDREKEIVTTTINNIYPNDRMFHIGAMVGIGDGATLVPMAAYQDRKNNIMMVGYDIHNEMFNVGMMIRISKK